MTPTCYLMLAFFRKEPVISIAINSYDSDHGNHFNFRLCFIFIFFVHMIGNV